MERSGTKLWLYTDGGTGSKFVIKTGQTPERRWQIERECEILKHLKHNNIIRTEDWAIPYSWDNSPALVMHYVPGGDLRHYMWHAGPLREDLVKRTIKKILEVLEYIHGVGLAHCDIKPENILVSGSYDGDNVVLSDFGLAVYLDDDGHFTLSGPRGTREYCAPEVHIVRAHDILSPKVDIWSLGVTCFECLMGRRPYAVEEIGSEVRSCLDDELIERMQCYFPDAYDLCVEMLQRDPEARISPSDALNHRWFTT